MGFMEDVLMLAVKALNLDKKIICAWIIDECAANAITMSEDWGLPVTTLHVVSSIQAEISGSECDKHSLIMQIGNEVCQPVYKNKEKMIDTSPHADAIIEAFGSRDPTSEGGMKRDIGKEVYDRATKEYLWRERIYGKMKRVNLTREQMRAVVMKIKIDQ